MKMQMAEVAVKMSTNETAVQHSIGVILAIYKKRQGAKLVLSFS